MNASPSEKSIRPFRDRTLDGLRGLAALTVVFNHLMVAFFPGTYWGSQVKWHADWEPFIGNSPLALLWAGHFAVCIFFVMSGFALSAMCSYSKLGLVAQLFRRYVRLALPVLALCALAFGLYQSGLFFHVAASPFTNSTEWLANAYHPTLSLLNVFMEGLLGVYVSKVTPVTDILWTIRMEMLGSVFIIMMIYLLRKRLPTSLYLAILLLLSGAIATKNIYFLLFAIGNLFFECSRPGSKVDIQSVGEASPLKSIMSVIGLVSALWLGSIPMIPAHYAIAAFRTLDPIYPHAVGAVILVFLTLRASFLKCVLNTVIPQFLGRISFSLYLVHFILICTLGCWSFLQFQIRGLSYFENVSLVAVISLAGSILVSWLMTRWVDEPGIRLSKMAGEWLDGQLRQLPIFRKLFKSTASLNASSSFSASSFGSPSFSSPKASKGNP